MPVDWAPVVPCATGEGYLGGSARRSSLMVSVYLLGKGEMKRRLKIGHRDALRFLGRRASKSSSTRSTGADEDQLSSSHTLLAASGLRLYRMPFRRRSSCMGVYRLVCMISGARRR